MSLSITEKQKSQLDSLRCKRLSSNENHLYMVDDFYCYRNDELDRIIKNEANSLDEERRKAFYLILNRDEKILAYFSLHASLLHKRNREFETRQNYRNLIAMVEKQIKESDDPTSLVALKKEYEKIYESNESRLKSELAFLETDDNKNVSYIYPAIEIGHLCVNDKYRHYWDTFGFIERIKPGMAIFWHHLVPIVLETLEYIGAEYLTLKAADDSEDRTLVAHYKSSMGFKENDELSAVWPVPDFGCILLSQEILELKNKQQDFYDNFNKIFEEE